MHQFSKWVIGSAVTACLMTGCGGGGAPSGPSGDVPSSSTTTGFTISASGVSPKQVTVSPGTRVLFTNNDQIAHWMYSDPHPDHTDCPELDNVGDLERGQTKESGNLNIVRTCGFHDHLHPDDARLKGQIIIR